MNNRINAVMIRGLLASTALEISLMPAAYALAPALQTPAPACAPSQDAAALAAADAPGARLAVRIDGVLPTAEDDRFLSIPWRTNLMEARREAQTQKRPIFLWMMVGNPLGCT